MTSCTALRYSRTRITWSLLSTSAALLLALSAASLAGCVGGVQRLGPTTRLEAPLVQPVHVDAASARAAQVRADRLAMAILDREGLYTLAGIKPLSTGIWSGRIELSEAATPAGEASALEREDVREALALLSRWPFYADVMTFATEHDGRRHVDAYIIHVPAMRRALVRHAVFARHGLSPGTHPAEVLSVVERMPRLERFEAYGHLFGYPSHAVDFFVRAAAEGEAIGELVPRDFVHIPTFQSAQHRFVYAVEKGHILVQEDLDLRERSQAVLSQYSALRTRFLGPRVEQGSGEAPVDGSDARDAGNPAPSVPVGAGVRLFWRTFDRVGTNN